jgi:hypothetical protein
MSEEEIQITAAEKPAGEEAAKDEPRPQAEKSAYEDGIYYEAAEDTAGGDEHGRPEEPVGPDQPEEPAEHDEDLETSDHDDEEATVRASTERDWLSEVSEAEDGETLEWPAPAAARSREQAELREEAGDEEPLAEPRVRHLFPVPENADWEVGELDYDRDTSKVS